MELLVAYFEIHGNVTEMSTGIISHSSWLQKQREHVSKLLQHEPGNVVYQRNLHNLNEQHALLQTTTRQWIAGLSFIGLAVVVAFLVYALQNTPTEQQGAVGELSEAVQKKLKDAWRSEPDTTARGTKNSQELTGEGGGKSWSLYGRFLPQRAPIHPLPSDHVYKTIDIPPQLYLDAIRRSSSPMPQPPQSSRLAIGIGEVGTNMSLVTSDFDHKRISRRHPSLDDSSRSIGVVKHTDSHKRPKSEWQHMLDAAHVWYEPQGWGADYRKSMEGKHLR
jgi:hypothetical protein